MPLFHPERHHTAHRLAPRCSSCARTVFNEGVKQGRTDRKNQNGRGYQGQSTYQSATKDYSSRLGDREVYQRYFREAYEHGYEDGN